MTESLLSVLGVMSGQFGLARLAFIQRVAPPF